MAGYQEGKIIKINSTISNIYHDISESKGTAAEYFNMFFVSLTFLF